MTTNITEFVKRIAPDVQMCPSVVITQKCVDAVQDFCKDSRRLTEGIQADVTDADIDDTLNDSVDIDVTAVAGTDRRPFAINQLLIDGDEHDAAYKQLVADMTIENIQLTNGKYFDFPDDTTIRLFPFSISANQTVEVFIDAAYVYLDGITAVEDFIWDDWRDAIIFRTKSLLCSMVKRPWTDLQLAEYYQRKYLGETGKCRTEIMKYRNQGSLKVKPRFF